MSTSIIAGGAAGVVAQNVELNNHFSILAKIKLTIITINIYLISNKYIFYPLNNM